LGATGFRRDFSATCGAWGDPVAFFCAATGCVEGALLVEFVFDEFGWDVFGFIVSTFLGSGVLTGMTAGEDAAGSFDSLDAPGLEIRKSAALTDSRGKINFLREVESCEGVWTMRSRTCPMFAEEPASMPSPFFASIVSMSYCLRGLGLWSKGTSSKKEKEPLADRINPYKKLFCEKRLLPHPSLFL
jgi:hypothetical protein